MYLVVLISLIFVLIIYLMFYMISYKSMDSMDNSSPYECGFDMGGGGRLMFSYRFFLISILFLVFDVEIVLLIPFTFFIKGILEMSFVLILIVGLIYEYSYGSLDWL